MLRFIITLLLVYLIYKVVITLLFPKKRVSRYPKQKPAENKVIDEMVKDPVCGIYLPKKDALPVSSGGKTIYFCSPQCRQRFLEAEKQNKQL